MIARILANRTEAAAAGSLTSVDSRRLARHGSRCFLAACLILGGMTEFARAQLSSDDIEALRKRGEAEGWTFTVTENDATRLPLENLCGAVEPPDWRNQGLWDSSPPRRGLPSAYDWRNYGGCTPIRNQGGCGSCWAFGAMGAVESYFLISRGLSLDLSEQWLVSCTGAGTCAGGWHTTSFDYLRCGGVTDSCGGTGAVMESAFPYVANDAPCGCPYSHPYCIPQWYFIGGSWTTPSVDQIKQAVVDHGPVSVCVYVDGAFQGYGGGIFNACTSAEINHVVVIVGWDDAQGTNGVWLMRNSWGPSWGEAGYMRIAYNCSMIGYAACYLDYAAEAGTTTLPFSDSFTSPTIDRNLWSGITGAEVNTLGTNPPSTPYSLDLDGSAVGGDSIRTAVINTTYLADIVLAYQWERKGGGDQPEAGDDLIVEYCDNNFDWIELARYPGSGPAMTSFSPASHVLLRSAYPSAFHGRFRVQLRVASTQAGLDDYFVDNVSITTTTDTQPPTALQWVQQPTTISTASITMSAYAEDPSGVDYYFLGVGPGGHSSGWQSSQTFTDFGLQGNCNYTYRVKARDRATPIQNETAYSPIVALATFIETPTALSFDAIADTSLQVSAPGTFTRLTSNGSGLFFEVTALDGTPVGGTLANTWVQTQAISVTDLTPGTTYRFRVRARNYYAVDETPWYPASDYVDQATTGGAPCLLLGDMDGDGLLNGLDIDGFVRAKLGDAPFTGENQACADFGGTLDQDVAAFVADLLGP